MKITSRRVGLLLALAVMLTVIGSAVSFATSSGSTISITPISTTSKQVADVSTLSVTYDAIIGKAKVTKGVALYKLSYASATDASSSRLSIFWTDPNAQTTGALKNPHSFINVGVYFLDSDQQAASAGGYSGDCVTSTQRSFTESSTTKYACPDTGTHASKVLTPRGPAEVLLLPSVSKTTLYVLSDINVPGGAPPGQQSTLQDLKFILQVVKL